MYIVFILVPLLGFAPVLFSNPPSSPEMEKKLVTATSTRKKGDTMTLLALSTRKKTSTVVNKEGRQSTVSLNTDNNEPQAKAPGEAENPLSFTDVGRIFSIIRDNLQQEGDAYTKEQAMLGSEAENPLSFTDVGRIFSIIRDNLQQEGDAYTKEQAMLGSLEQADQQPIPTDETNGMNEYLDEYLAKNNAQK